VTARDARPIPLITSLQEVIADYDALVVDIWGVLHNGVRAFPGAPSALRAARAAGRHVLLLSNAPRPAEVIIPQLANLGIERDCYGAIVTSGDLTRRLIAADLSRPILHIGPPRDLPLFEGLALTFVDDAEAAVIVCTGLFDDTVETPEHYRERLKPLVARGVPMICANPDLTVERGGTVIYCAGALGQLYAALGGAVTWAGKPHAPVYDLAFAEIVRLAGRDVARPRILAIGDGLKTDIAGAAAVGIPALYVASAIHVSGPLTAEVLGGLFPAEAPARPVAATAALAW
jgi:HAD superfamily hydrolase (TIGR01459 family)